MRPLRLRRLLGEMLDTVPAYSPGLVAYELVRRHLGTSAAHVYGELRGVLFAECDLRGVPYAAVEVSAAKREATGRGNAGKEAMTEAARARWPEALLGTDDEADALWIAAAALRELPASDRAG
jgi:Holliday junction resolvasome RuvABC endonuclease subunit